MLKKTLTEVLGKTGTVVEKAYEARKQCLTAHNGDCSKCENKGCPNEFVWIPVCKAVGELLEGEE